MKMRVIKILKSFILIGLKEGLKVMNILKKLIKKDFTPLIIL
jgi:ribosomal protein L7/L12